MINLDTNTFLFHAQKFCPIPLNEMSLFIFRYNPLPHLLTIQVLLNYRTRATISRSQLVPPMFSS